MVIFFTKLLCRINLCPKEERKQTRMWNLPMPVKMGLTHQQHPLQHFLKGEGVQLKLINYF